MGWRTIFVATLLLGVLAPAAHAHGGACGRFLGDPPLPSEREPGPLTFENWVFWFHHNADRLEAEAAPTRRILPAGPTATPHTQVLATLRTFVERWSTHHPALAAEACRALARTTNDARDGALLTRVLTESRLSPTVAEGAALGLGMLRRTDPGHRLPPQVLIDARKTLFATLDTGTAPARGLAALAIGLLGDQAFGAGEASAARVARRLLELAEAATTEGDVRTGLLIALSLQPAAADDAAVLDALGLMVSKGAAAHATLRDTSRTQAALALGTLGRAEDLDPLERTMRARRGVPVNVKRAAAIAYGRLAARLPAKEKARAERWILEAIKAQRDASTRHFLTMALVPILRGRADRDRVTGPAVSPGWRHLLHVAEKGTYLDRPYAALALGLLLHSNEPGRTGKTAKADRSRALDALQKGLGARTTPSAYAGFALALGLARDAHSFDALRAIAADPRRSEQVRTHALLGLALGTPDAETHALALARWRAKPLGAHPLTMRAIGITAHAARNEDLETLRKALVEAKPKAVKVEAAIAMARFASPQAARLLQAIALDSHEQDLTRSVAIRGLGRIADPERVSSLVRLYECVQYRSQAGLTAVLLSIL